MRFTSQGLPYDREPLTSAWVPGFCRGLGFGVVLVIVNEESFRHDDDEYSPKTSRCINFRRTGFTFRSWEVTRVAICKINMEK